MGVESPPGLERRERKQQVEGHGLQPDNGADLDEVRLPDDAAGPAPGDLPGGVRTAGVGRLRQAELKALGEEDENVEESAWKRDVVIDHEQPVVTLGRICARADR